MSWTVSKIFTGDQNGHQQVCQLLSDQGIEKDRNLDYTCGIFDQEGNLIATGSCFGNTLRCLAVNQEFQGQGLLNLIITHLINYQIERGHHHIFLYSKPEAASFFSDLGFYEIARNDGQIVFFENKKDGFSTYLKNLEPHQGPANHVAALVVNANPFTLGHQYLIEKAASQNDVLHLFVVSEDRSLVPFDVRKNLVIAGTAHLNNIIYHDSGSYMISQATFPSYFLKDSEAVILGQAMLDVQIFTAIAKNLGITKRYMGEEPTSLVTNLYNQVMLERLPQAGISCQVIPRKEVAGKPISASTVRQAIKDGDFASLAHLVPATTLAFFESPQAQPIIRKIKKEANVIHY